MKKVLPALVLTATLGFLAMPMLVSAALPPCPQSCQDLIEECQCGGFQLTPGDHWCYNNLYFSEKQACLDAMPAGTTGVTGANGQVVSPPPSSITSIEALLGIVNKVINYVFTFVLGVAAIFVIIAGFNFMTAAGDQTKITNARKFLTNALIGIAIAVGVRGLMMIIGKLVGVTTPLTF